MLRSVILLLVFCWGCQDTEKPAQRSSSPNPPVSMKRAEIPDSLLVLFAEPISTDSGKADIVADASGWVILPLSDETQRFVDKRSKSLYDIGSSDSYESTSYQGNDHIYWNLIFKNILTGESKLLDKNRTFYITDLQTRLSAKSHFFKDIPADWNQDGIKNYKDPDVWFACSKAGEHLRRISPEKEQSGTLWKIVPGYFAFTTKTDTDQDSIWDDQIRFYVFCEDSLGNPAYFPENLLSESESFVKSYSVANGKIWLKTLRTEWGIPEKNLIRQEIWYELDYQNQKLIPLFSQEMQTKLLQKSPNRNSQPE